MAKTKVGAWEYDIIGPWYKCNMTDIMAAIGLRQLDRYLGLLERREVIMKRYDATCDELGISHMVHHVEGMDTFIQNLVDKFNALTPAQQQVIVKIGLVVAAIGPLLVIIGKLLTSVGTIMTWAPKIVNGVSSIMGIGSKLMGGLQALWGVIIANPITLIVAAIAAAVAAFIYFWNTSEEFRQFWIGLWEAIKTAVQTVVQAIATFFTQTMLKFDKNMKNSGTVRTPYEWLKYACDACSMPLGVTEEAVTAMPNGTRSLSWTNLDEDKTWRDLIAHVATVLCGVCQIDRSGALTVIPFTNSPVMDIPASWRYQLCSFGTLLSADYSWSLTERRARMNKLHEVVEH